MSPPQVGSVGNLADAGTAEGPAATRSRLKLAENGSGGSRTRSRTRPRTRARARAHARPRARLTCKPLSFRLRGSKMAEIPGIRAKIPKMHSAPRRNP